MPWIGRSRHPPTGPSPAAWDPSLSAAQTQAVLSKRGCISPLYLRTVCDHLRVHGRFHGLDAAIAALPDETPELFDSIVAQLEKDHGSELVGCVLGHLRVSREGLLEEDLKAEAPQTARALGQ